VRLEKKPIPAEDLLKDIASEFRLEAEDREVELAVDCGGRADLMADGDERRLRQVIGNLTANALRFTPKGGKVTLLAQRRGDKVVFSVEDTGAGIASEECAKIFGRHYQASNQASQTVGRGKGLGLGLQIAQGLVELHGGTIWVQSEPGEGARFHFTIPARTGPADPARVFSPPITVRRSYSRR